MAVGLRRGARASTSRAGASVAGPELAEGFNANGVYSWGSVLVGILAWDGGGLDDVTSGLFRFPDTCVSSVRVVKPEAGSGAPIDYRKQVDLNPRFAEIMKTTFIITVDVESKARGDPGQDILGAIPGYQGNYGIERIMDLLEEHQVRATFFLNVYEIAKHGDAVVSRAARMIHSRGHDLELHTHPRPMFKFYGMSQASLGEQKAILEKGVSLLEQWTGKKVVAHRAGAFSANTDTLRAVTAVGLLADCSLSAGSHVDVPLVAELGPSNAVQRADKVWEFPVTCFDQVRVGPWKSRRILDIEGCSLPEIKLVTRWAVRRGLPTVCILMHSFSLSRHDKPNRPAIRRFSALLAWLREQEDIEMGTIEQVCARLEGGAVIRPDATIPGTGVWLTWGRAVGSWNDGWKNFAVAMTGMGCIALLVLVLVCLGYVVMQH